eukprot:SAG22_NODE_590_length_8826_cov_6.627134_6_plen_79_part_00
MYVCTICYMYGIYALHPYLFVLLDLLALVAAGAVASGGGGGGTRSMSCPSSLPPLAALASGTVHRMVAETRHRIPPTT